VSYQNAIPQATDKISVSQGDLLGNFQEVNTAWNANHVPFNLSSEGSHWFISMPNQTVSGTFPPRTDGVGPYANSMGLYALAGQLWFRPAGQAVGVRTNDKLLTTAQVNNATNSITLPNGLIMKWGIGQGNSVGAGFANVFPVAFPHLCFTVQANTINAAYNVNNFINLNFISSTGFNCTSASRSGGTSTCAITWLAIGW
jgi:hypothetical protein